MSKPHSKLKSIISVVLVIAVILGGCIAAVSIYAKNAITEGTVELEKEPAVSLTPEPDRNGFSDYLNKMISLTGDSSKVKTKVETSVHVDSDSIKTEASKADLNTLKYIINSAAGKYGELYPSHDGDFGDGFNDLPSSQLSGDDIDEFKFERGTVDPDDKETIGEDNYNYFDVTVKSSEITPDSGISTTFNAFEIDKVIEALSSDAAELFDITSAEISLGSNRIDGKVQRLLDRIDNVRFTAEFLIKIDVSFKGAYSALGEKTLEFKYIVETKYSYGWAGVDITEDSISYKVGEEEALPISAVISDKATKENYTIAFTSSDESVLTVDKDGNTKAVKESKNPVTVTVELKYLGNTYTDSCEVYVLNPVEKVKTQPEELQLNIGESKALTCKISPDNATIKDVLWFTEDESIAGVTADGTVTAAGKGTVKVYAVSVDGHFRSSCVITVGEVK